MPAAAGLSFAIPALFAVNPAAPDLLERSDAPAAAGLFPAIPSAAVAASAADRTAAGAAAASPVAFIVVVVAVAAATPGTALFAVFFAAVGGLDDAAAVNSFATAVSPGIAAELLERGSCRAKEASEPGSTPTKLR